MNKADTCRTLVRPRLETAGWDGDKHFYSEQTPFTDGRIIVPRGKPKRLRNKFSDFLLRYTRDITLAVVEAMLAQVHLLRHRLESPQIVRGNSLAQQLTDIKERDRVGVILTNPPGVTGRRVP
jgi:type I site-specific restriction endonuclease